VEIKCQLDETDEFLLQILLLAQHVSGNIMPITRSSRGLYRWLLPVVFGALVFKLSVWCGAVGYVSGLRAAAAARKPQFTQFFRQVCLHTVKSLSLNEIAGGINKPFVIKKSIKYSPTQNIKNREIL
jgi:hypothetical protein